MNGTWRNIIGIGDYSCKPDFTVMTGVGNIPIEQLHKKVVKIRRHQTTNARLASKYKARFAVNFSSGLSTYVAVSQEVQIAPWRRRTRLSLSLVILPALGSYSVVHLLSLINLGAKPSSNVFP